MTSRTPKASKDTRVRIRVSKFRENMRERGWKRKEIWVPDDMTREEAGVLQDWIEEILIDIRRAPPA